MHRLELVEDRPEDLAATRKVLRELRELHTREDGRAVRWLRRSDPAHHERPRGRGSSGENIFRVKDGLLTTPTKSAGVLEGITRDSVIQIAKDNGIPFKEEDFIREDIFAADELFLCGTTAANVTPINEVDNRMIGNGSFAITKKIQEAYLDAIHGRTAKYDAMAVLREPAPNLQQARLREGLSGFVQ